MAITRVAIVYYSMYGHISELAKRQKAGVDSVEGCEGVLLQVKETLSLEVTAKMQAPPQAEDVPFVDHRTLPEYDGFLFGIPTKFGNTASQFKDFWDKTGKLWTEGALCGKHYGVFVSVGTQGGGMEETVITSISNFVHHGLVFVPVGYTFGAGMHTMDEVRGGSAWGAGTFAGADGIRRPSQLELDFAEHQGRYTAGFVRKMSQPMP